MVLNRIMEYRRICNETIKNLRLNMTHPATNKYIMELATLIGDNPNPAAQPKKLYSIRNHFQQFDTDILSSDFLIVFLFISFFKSGE